MRNLAAVILGVIVLGLTGGVGYVLGRSLPRPTPLEQASKLRDDEELRRLYDDDQADRSPGQSVDGSVVSQRDRVRRSRVKVLLTTGRLGTPTDYYHAAMIFQHGDVPEDFLFAHELAVIAIIKGKNDREARLLAAEGEDRFLTHIGRPQRFATQLGMDGSGPWQLKPVDTAVTDDFRRLMGAPSIEEARAQEAELNQKQPLVYSAADADVRPPIEIDRRMPIWNPSTQDEKATEYRGVLEVVIDEHGNPMSATIRRPSAASYDQLLVATIQHWRFKPATRNGEPVRYRATFDIVLPPRPR